ncbi:TonB-dependent receptor [Parabacteroides bouchesdurhonensis]|uniref:TonB-dependent receptor n=1 Tax=Parabacteroides bouchesdurhonensis TaxID=1936995 RepID=UPI000C814C4F|nr:TonB-dependent receptor [Parabacteroides bouchesdurhonensis]
MKLLYYVPMLLILSQTVLGVDVENDTLKLQQVDLNEVVIQSFKQGRDLRVAPIAATSISGTAIRNRNITNIKDFSAAIPNLFMPDYGSKLTSPVYIRGIGSKINAPSVGLYVDGIPYFEKSAFDFDFTEIDRIEVLRGPQGTLYGRNTMGGIINVYTKSPLKYQGTNIVFSGGNYTNIDASASHYGRINKKLGYALSGNYNHAGGYFINMYTGNKADRQNSGSGRMRLEWELQPQLTMQLISNLDYSDQGGYPYAVCDSATYKPGSVNYNDYSYYKRLISTTGITLEYHTEQYSINSQTAFQYLNDHQGIDQDFSPQPVYFAKQDQRQKMVSEEFNIKSTGKGQYNWLFGAFAFWQGIDNTVILNYLSKDYSTRKIYDTPTYGIALYHQSSIDNLFTRGLSLTLGIRYDYERASTDFIYHKDTQSQSEQVDAFYSKLNFSQITPKIALQYMFPSAGMIYATVAKGYKTGGFNTSFERDEDRSFLPENSWNYEIGAKHPLLDKRLQAEVAFFWIDWKNQQISQPLPSGKGSMLKNAGRSRSRGIELSLQGNLFNGFMLQANYGFTQATFKTYTNGNKSYAGNFLPMVPAHTFSVGADYTISRPCNHIDRFTISTNYIGTGRIYWKEDNNVSQPYYGQLNGKISATKDFLTFAIWTKNITNTEYTAFYFETGGKGLAQKGRPFTIGADIQVSF